ncbi:hypothetical protein BsWGS_01763 [Bradybaena similaris]
MEALPYEDGWSISKLRSEEALNSTLNAEKLEGALMPSFQYRVTDGEFHWSSSVQSLIQSSFYWGYVVTQIPAGVLCQRYGGKKFLGWSMFLSGAITLLVPIAARVGYPVLILLRSFLGLCQGVIWPAAIAIWSRWAPPLERQRLVAGCFSGVALGVVGVYPLSSALCYNDAGGGWESVFFVSGSVAIIWCFIWSLYAYDTPDEHPHISMKEKMYIKCTLLGTIKMYIDVDYITPWESILTCKPFWALVVVQVSADFTVYFEVFCGYIYMERVLNMQPEERGYMVALPYFGFFVVNIISAILYDFCSTELIYSTTLARKIGVSAALLIPAVLIFCLGFLGYKHRVAAMILLGTSIAASGLHFGTGYLTIVADIAPPHAAIMIGISNTIAGISAMVLQPIVTHLSTDNRQDQWHILFHFICALNLLCCIIFNIWGSGEIQDWARLSSEEESFRETPSRMAEIYKRYRVPTSTPTTATF